RRSEPVGHHPEKWVHDSVSTDRTLVRLRWLQQDVALLAKRKLDDACWREMRPGERHLVVGDRGVVHAQSAALDLAARFAVRGDETGPDECGQDAEPRLELGPGNFDRRQGLR